MTKNSLSPNIPHAASHHRSGLTLIDIQSRVSINKSEGNPMQKKPLGSLHIQSSQAKLPASLI